MSSVDIKKICFTMGKINQMIYDVNKFIEDNEQSFSESDQANIFRSFLGKISVKLGEIEIYTSSEILEEFQEREIND